MAIKPIISIVLPTYNGDEYLDETIKSIKNQTFKDWELILVDDCSTDSTSAICARYERVNERIRVFRNEKNSKTPASLNRGFREAKGKYLTWMTDDNLYYPAALEKMLQYLNEHEECQFVYANMDTIDEGGNIVGSFRQDNFTRMYYNDIVGGCFLYTRKCYEEIGDYSDEFFPIEDYEYFLRVLEKYGEFGYLNEKLFAFRVYKNAQSYQKFFDMKVLLNERIRKPKFDWLFNNLLNNPDYLFGLYIDMQITGSVTKELKNRFLEKLPEIDCLYEIKGDDSDVIVYGAGDFGGRTYEILKDRILGFADRSPGKIGTQYCGKPVFSPEEVKIKYKDNVIVIALESDLVLGVLKDFNASGIKKSLYIKNWRINNNMVH